jgi:UDP-glucose 4-epimerase
VFNIASRKEITILELAKTIQEMTQGKSELKFCPPQSGDIPRSVADVTKAKSELGFVAGTSILDGLSATLQWFR